MASRNRNRLVPAKDDADEERSLWNQLQSDARRVDSMVSESNANWNRMCEIKEALELQYAHDEETSAELEAELMKLSRENLKLCEEVNAALSESDASSLLGSINILKALRQSSEAETYAPPPLRAAANPKSARNPKRKHDAAAGLSADDRDRDSAAAESPAPGPSPKVIVPSASRLKASSRAGSVPAGREASVKIEDVDSGVDSLTKHEKARFVPDAEVFFQHKASGRGAQDRDDMGEGILCTIIGGSGEGKARRYEILDVDDGHSKHRASQSQLVLIPSGNESLPEVHAKKTVLAMYPRTTTFYRAEVVAVKAKDLNPRDVRLRFEDEDNENTEMDVSRRYVLVDWPGK